MAVTNGDVPTWQPDADVAACPLCDRSFTMMFRRHHCRKCGRVVCGSCSEHFVRYLATTFVVSPPHQIYLESPLVPHRTCNSCASELEMIQKALAPATAEARELMVQNVSHVQDELNRCPVCEKLLVHKPQREQELHIDRCLAQFGQSPRDKNHRNRMIIYKLPSKEATSLGECTVCFEDFLPGQNVGRLECLCVFHESCIIKWYTKKGAGKCPVHNQ